MFRSDCFLLTCFDEPWHPLGLHHDDAGPDPFGDPDTARSRPSGFDDERVPFAPILLPLALENVPKMAFFVKPLYYGQQSL